MESDAWEREWEAAVAARRAQGSGQAAGGDGPGTSGRPPPYPAWELNVLRVNQIDAVRLDHELTGMLKEQFMKVFSHFKPGLVSSFQPELVLVLEYLVFHFSIWRAKSTPGNGLMNLRYRDERAMHKVSQRTGIEGPGLTRTQCIIFGIATFGLRYFWERLDRLSTFGQWSGPWGALTWRSLLRVKASLRVLQTLNSFAFLRFGRYPRLIERVLQARLVYSRPNMNRAVSFEYMNRQLVWQELSELLLFILPLINIGKIRRFLVDRCSPAHSSAELPAAACSICLTNPARTPFESVDCGHVFCYYCVRANCEADRFYRCSRCGKPVGSIRRCRTQQVVELSSSSDAVASKQLR